MAKRVFFSFHYQDVIDFRANVVRNHWQLKPNREISGYYDASIWEAAKKQGDMALKRLINKGLDNTSNTCVLIGSQTYNRPWVRYEILKSFKKGNHIFAVHINSIKDRHGKIKSKGFNPLEYVGVTFSESGRTATLWEKANGKWVKYEKVDGSASYRCNSAVNVKGKGFNMTSFYKTYDWVTDLGYQNFSKWVG
ncbi:TIR domain-containing protein [Halomonas saccharevitans]|uniref:TIR domain-containing protein n=1 Tax=Halomonas saccharevitans TaxID=416872 RepID=A0ABU3ND01_9GAMM|nr:TIR domain-containing protein [Halomonas saccharevitans]MDT8878897.1 TIR domain-containing protein [Halomonas saccharevitans]